MTVDVYTKKQILYPGVAVRLFSSMIDISIISYVMIPIFMTVWFYSFKIIFSGDNFNIVNETDINTIGDFLAFLRVESIPILMGNDEIMRNKIILLQSIYVSLYATCLALYFLCSWYYFSTTLGKYLFRLMIVNSDTLEKPTLKMLVLRFFAGILYPISVFSMIITKKHIALHDKISHTIVVKK